MRNFFRNLICTALAFMCLFLLCLPVLAAEPARQSVEFAAYCESEAEIAAAIEAGASYISIGSDVDLHSAKAAINGKAKLIIDAESIDEAEEKHSIIGATSYVGGTEVCYRIKASAGKAVKWAESKGASAKIIGLYTGNIYPAALSAVNRFGKYENSGIVQLQTGNQDGVVLHNTVTAFFAKSNIKGMFSFINAEKSAKRTDSARSWDDLVARGYEIIETAYPADFAEYLAQNTAEREKLQLSINAAHSADLKSGFPNRISTYNKTLAAAEELLNDGSCATYEMADMRARLDEAVKNLTVDDGKKVKGDFEITPGRIAAALFGIALVLSWQIFFRSRWNKSVIASK